MNPAVFIILIVIALIFYRSNFRRTKAQLSDFYLDTTSYSLQTRFQLRQIIETSGGLAAVLGTGLLMLLLVNFLYLLVAWLIGRVSVTPGLFAHWTLFLSSIPRLVLNIGMLIQSTIFFAKFPKLFFKGRGGEGAQPHVKYTVGCEEIEIKMERDRKSHDTVPKDPNSNVEILERIWSSHAARVSKISPISQTTVRA